MSVRFALPAPTVALVLAVSTGECESPSEDSNSSGHPFFVKYTVYRTVNNLNGRFYIGVHKTDNPTDLYLGSGKFLKASVKKYGAAVFTKIVLAVFDSASEAFSLERDLVLAGKSDSLCMNLKDGGCGGFDYINTNGKNGATKAISTRDPMGGVKALRYKKSVDPVFRDKMDRQWADCRSKALLSVNRFTPKRFGPHSIETRLKLADKNRGEGNSQWGTIWITNGPERRKIKSDDPMPDGWSRAKKVKIKKPRRGKKPLVHGTEHGYKKWRCRCEECRTANRNVVAFYRKKFEGS